MPKRSRKEIADPNRSAANVLKQMFKKAEAEGKDPLAVALGRRGGLKGGHARAEKMTAEERSDSARKAAKARWKAK
jgi:RNase adaptor protein for sRNA GlmZ degradation